MNTASFRRLETFLLARLRDETAIFMVLTVVTGILGGLVVLAFHYLSAGLASVIFGDSKSGVVEGFRALPLWARVALPVAGGLVAGTIRWLLVPEGGRGLPEILEAVTMGAGILRVRRAVPTGLSSITTYATGGSVGREGAIVQITAALASWLGRHAPIDRPRLKMLVGCGVAAGIAAAYRTPLTGALFAMEIIYRRLAFDELGPIVVSSVAATLTAYVLLGKSPIYDVAQLDLKSYYEMIPCILIGILSGPAAIVLQRSLRAADVVFRKIPGPLPVRTTIGGLLVGAIAAFIPEVTGNGYEPLREVLASPHTVTVLAVILVGKLVATSVTVGSGGAGGVVTPTLLMGATLGGIVGELASQRLQAHGEAGAYALVGMGCLLAASMRAPFMAILMVFETTQDYDLVLPMMIASVVAFAGARAMDPDSIYSSELRRRGISWEGDREADFLQSHQVREVIRTRVPLLPATMNLDTLLKIFRDTRELLLYVGDEQGRFLGVIDLHDVKDFLGKEGMGTLVLAADLVSPVPPVEASSTLLEVERRLRTRDIGHLPVVDSLDSGRFLGIVTRKDLLAAVERAKVISEVDEIQEEEARRGRLETRPVTQGLVGVSADAVTEEQVAGVVVAVRRPGSDGTYSVHAPRGTVLAEGDLLVVVPEGA